jgi:uncharacterized membrane protein YjjP (DUF1212 family)
MDYNTLLDLATDLGYELAMCGAETFRVEESIERVLLSYGIKSEVFAIPNCLTVSIETAEGKPMTRMRRIGYHGNDLDGVERFSGLSRAICTRKPDPADAREWLEHVRSSRRKYSLPMDLIGNFLGAFGFAMVFGGSIVDGLCGGICGLLVGVINRFMDKMKANQFFRTIAAAFPMALLAYAMQAVGLSHNADMVTIGALMILVPGLLFTNAMRDIIYGDTNSGTNRIVQVFLIAAAIALGTAAAWNVSSLMWGAPAEASSGISLLESLIPCFVGCMGFCIIFNIHGKGSLFCALGGVLVWIVYSLTLQLGGSDLAGYFWGTLVAAGFSELMARVRKCPAISYLVVAIFPLIPGAGVYYTMRYAVLGQMDLFASQLMHTAAIAGIMAVAILLVSTSVRLWFSRKMKKV